MVYNKERSGDPDYDDKQPIEHHQGGIVSAGDGVWISKVNGPVDAEGQHVNLAVDETDLDNRPAPGEVATKPSEVQTYDTSDTPTAEADADSADVDAIKAGQTSVRAAAENAGQTDTRVVTDEDTPAKPAPTAMPKRATTSKTT